MSRTLQLRRGSKADLPTLALGELGYCTDTKELYIGNGISNTLIDPLILLNGVQGLIVKNGPSSYINRILAAVNGISITNADGIAGNPTVTPVYGDTANTICQGNDPRLLSSNEKGYLETLIAKEAYSKIEALLDGISKINVVNARSVLYTLGYSIRNIVDAAPANNPSIYESIVTLHQPYSANILLSGFLDSPNYEIEWTTQTSGDNVQIGVEAIGNNSDEVVVTIPTAYLNNDYSIIYCIRNLTDAIPAQMGSVITAKGLDTFTIKLSDLTDSANYELVWATQQPNGTLQTGEANILNNSDTITVNLPTSFTDSYYIINVNLINTTDGTPSTYATVITQQTSSSFKVELSGLTDTEHYKLGWTVHEAGSTASAYNFDGGGFV